MIRVLLLLLSAAPAMALQPVDELRPLAADAEVSISLVAENLTVRVWEQPNMALRGSIADGAELRIVATPERLQIEVRLPEQRRRAGPASLELWLPPDTPFSAETVSGAIDLQGLSGRHLHLRTVSGAIEADSEAEQVELQTVSGNLQLRHQGARLRATTVSGRLRLHSATAELALQSVSGGIEVEAEALQRLQAKTVSGAITATLGSAAGARLELESLSGQIQALLGSAPRRLELSSHSGRVDSAWGEVRQRPAGAGASLNFQTDGDGPDVRAQSFSGHVSLGRR